MSIADRQAWRPGEYFRDYYSRQVEPDEQAAIRFQVAYLQRTGRRFRRPDAEPGRVARLHAQRLRPPPAGRRVRDARPARLRTVSRRGPVVSRGEIRSADLRSALLECGADPVRLEVAEAELPTHADQGYTGILMACGETTAHA